MKPNFEFFKRDRKEISPQLQLSHEYRNIIVETTVNSFIYVPKLQPFSGKDTNIFNPEGEDVEDPEYLSDTEVVEIKRSLQDYAEGKFKSGSIEDLLNDLKD